MQSPIPFSKKSLAGFCFGANLILYWCVKMRHGQEKAKNRSKAGIPFGANGF
jgi:hypothetical protein